MLIHLATVCGCFCVTMATLNSCNKNRMAHNLVFLQKYLLTPGLEYGLKLERPGYKSLYVSATIWILVP